MASDPTLNGQPNGASTSDVISVYGSQSSVKNSTPPAQNSNENFQDDRDRENENNVDNTSESSSWLGYATTIVGLGALGAAMSGGGGSGSDSAQGGSTDEGNIYVRESDNFTSEDEFYRPSDSSALGPIDIDMLAGDDHAVFVGQISFQDAQNYENLLSSEAISDHKYLLKLIENSDLEAKSSTDLQSGSSLDGGPGQDTLVIIGKVDLREVSLSGFENMELFSNVAIFQDQLTSLQVVNINGSSPHVINIYGRDNQLLSEMDVDVLLSSGNILIRGEGTVIINGETFTFAPGDDQNSGNDFNFAPIASNDFYDGVENTPIITGNVIANDTDPDGSLTDSNVTGIHSSPLNGTVRYLNDGTFEYTPDTNFVGEDSFSYKIVDNEGKESTATVFVNVVQADYRAIANDDTFEVDEDSMLITGNVLDNDDFGTGVSSPEKIVSFSEPTNGTLKNLGDGTFEYIPDPNFNGVDSFTYTVKSGDSGPSSGTVTITVHPVNDMPTLVNDAVTGNEDSTIITGNVLSNDNDIDGPLSADSIVSHTQGANGSVSYNGDGTFDYIPNPDFFGSDQFTYTVSDSDGGVATATVDVTIQGVDDTPVAVDDVQAVKEDGVLVTDNVLDNDYDPDSELTPESIVSFSTTSNGSLSYNEDGTFTYRPNENWSGTDSFTYTVKDANGLSDAATVTISVGEVNDVPLAQNDTASGSEDTSIQTQNVLENDVDKDDSLTSESIKSFTQGENGSVTYNGDGTFTYTPNSNFNGPDNFSYTIDDGRGGQSTATVFVNVLPINDAPVANEDVVSTNEDTSVTFNVLDNDKDPDNQLAYENIVSYSLPTNGSLTDNGDGSFTFTPDENWAGSTNFEYTIQDADSLESTANVSISVQEVNDLPLAQDDELVIAEDSDAVNISVLSNDSDDDDVLNAESIVSVSDAANGTVSKNSDGTISYKPDQNFNGSDSFEYTISDGRGGESTASVNVVVTASNDVPVANDDMINAAEDNEQVINVLDNDIDVDDELSGDSISDYTDPSNGTLTFDQTSGAFSYRPNLNFSGTDSFTYTIRDDEGGTDSAVVTINIAEVNDSPLANNDSASGYEDTVIVTSNVLGNDSDPDDALLPSSVKSFTQASNGSVGYNGDGTFTYTPVADFNGEDSFTYTIEDGRGGESTGTVNLTVESVNDAPVARDDISGGMANSEITTVNVLLNDSDVDDFLDATSIESFTQTSNGSLSSNGDGTFLYTPDTDFTGIDTFEYTISDASGATSTATSSIEVVSPLEGLSIEGNKLLVDPDADIDLREIENHLISGIETIDMENDSSNTFTMDESDFLSMIEDDKLLVWGDTGDALNVEGEFSFLARGVDDHGNYDIYVHDSSGYSLWVEENQVDLTFI